MNVLISNLNMIESIKLDIASAIEAKGVSMSGVSFPDYPSAIASISGGGGGYTLKDIAQTEFISGTGSTYYDSTITLIDFGKFVGARTKPGGVLSYIQGVLNQNYDFPNCSEVYNYAFYYNRLSSISLPICKYIGEHTFENCKFSSINLPMCTSINTQAFSNCSSMSQISIPNCKFIGDYAFHSTGLISIDLPECLEISNYAFQYCNSLTTVNLSVCSIIGGSVFKECHSLQTITLGSTSVCSGGRNMFSGTHSALSILVPSSLVDTYKAATNWSTYSSRIFPIPE